jgi:hypothetical protein
MLEYLFVNDIFGMFNKSLKTKLRLIFISVRRQVVNIPSFIVRLDSQKHIDFALRSPLSSGGRPGIIFPFSYSRSYLSFL